MMTGTKAKSEFGVVTEKTSIVGKEQQKLMESATTLYLTYNM
jgi:hypothetical protein